jgi:hypothetical protein
LAVGPDHRPAAGRLPELLEEVVDVRLRRDRKQIIREVDVEQLRSQRVRAAQRVDVVGLVKLAPRCKRKGFDESGTDSCPGITDGGVLLGVTPRLALLPKIDEVLGRRPPAHARDRLGLPFHPPAHCAAVGLLAKRVGLHWHLGPAADRKLLDKLQTQGLGLADAPTILRIPRR